jgi:hypothetical protein
MATTSIGSDRQQGSAREDYTDANFYRDDKKLYFGNGGDFSVEYDEDGNDVLLTAGANIRISDTQQLQFGDSGDVTMSLEATSDVLLLTGIPTSDPGVSDAIWANTNVLTISAGA